MSGASIAGLALYNFLLLGAGCAVLWAGHGWATWAEFTRLLGLAYVLGFAAMGVLLTLELVVGVPFGVVTLLMSVTAIVVVGLVVGSLRGRRLGRVGRSHGTRQTKGPIVVTAIGASCLVIYLEAMFRAGRLAGLFEWDAMSFWVPRAGAIYELGGIDNQLFASVPGPSYPPLVPAHEAAAFAFMGAPDAITLHLLGWFFVLGFFAAVVGLLAPRVHALLLWPIVLLAAVTPAFLDHGLEIQADVTLDGFFALGVLLFALALLERRPSFMALGAILLMATVLTKREGQLYAACLLVVTLGVSWRERRRIWPMALGAGALAGVGVAIWRAGLSDLGIPPQGPERGYLDFLGESRRWWPALELTFSTVFNARAGLVLMPLLLVAVFVAALARERLALFAGALSILLCAAFTWITLSFPSVPITKDNSVNPIQRETAVLVFIAVVVVPLLLQLAWNRDGAQPLWLRRIASPRLDDRRLAALLVGAVALLYPALALSQGSPHFPSRSDCHRQATGDGNLELVLGTFRSMAVAAPFTERVRSMGFIQAEAHGNGCGEVEVGVRGYTSLAGARDAAGEARRAHLSPSIEMA